MKNKLFLEEGEISRILNMHKRAINEELNVNGDEVENNEVQMDEELSEDGNENPQTYTTTQKHDFEPVDYGFLGDNTELRIFKGAVFKKNGGVLEAKTMYQFVNTLNGYPVEIPSKGGINFHNESTINGTVTYICGQGKFLTNYESDLFYDEDGYLQPHLNKLCQTSNNQTPKKTGGGGAPTSGDVYNKCLKTIKGMVDTYGYTYVTLDVFNQAPADKRTYKWCPDGKSNLYFTKGWSGSSDKNPGDDGPPVYTGGGGRKTYTFDVAAVNKLIDAKCPKDGKSKDNSGINLDATGTPTPTPIPNMTKGEFDSL